MKSALLPLAPLLALCPAIALAQQQASFTPDQKAYIAYHYCMMQAAMKASHTDAGNDDIYPLAREACAEVRAQAVAVGHEFPELLSALEAADSEKEANFPDWVKGVRERRAKFEAGSAAPPASR